MYLVFWKDRNLKTRSGKVDNMLDINTSNGQFALFIAELISARLRTGMPPRNDFLASLQDEPELIEGMILLWYDSILVLADNQQGIQPTFSKGEGLREIMTFLTAFFAVELVAFAEPLPTAT